MWLFSGLERIRVGPPNPRFARIRAHIGVIAAMSPYPPETPEDPEDARVPDRPTLSSATIRGCGCAGVVASWSLFACRAAIAWAHALASI